MNTLLSLISQGLIFSLVAIAVYLTSRVIKKDDLTVEGSFGFGGAISAYALSLDFHPLLTLVIAIICGAGIGLCTGVLYTKLKMNHLMAGLITTTGCFSLSLFVASANKTIAFEKSIFALSGLSETNSELIILSTVAIFLVFLVRLFLQTEFGLLLRATGGNHDLLVHFGKSKDAYYMLGFSIANALTALAGSLFIQWSGFFSITGNIGTLITGLASLMIAELISKNFSYWIIFSAICYQAIFAVTLEVGVPPVWNNLLKAMIMISLVAMSTKAVRSKKHA